MAHVEPEVLPLENKEADYEKVKLELESKVAAIQGNNVELRSGEVQLVTFVANATKDNLRPIDSHVWSNPIMPTLLPHLRPWSYYALKTVTPTQLKWGFSYATGPPDDTTAQKWVVAFDTGAGKVYSEAGPMGPIDWNVVEVKLESSGSTSDFAWINAQSAYAIFH